MKLYNGETFEHRGYSFRVEVHQDDGLGEPWMEHDGHGIVSEWTTRDKAPGERVLITDRQSRRYYDVAETMKLARKDKWGCSKHEHKTKREEIACAVDRDYERLRAWCDGRWYWVYVVVRLLEEDEDGELTDTKEFESLGGIESDCGDYLDEVAKELAEEIVGRVEVDNPDIVLSEN